MKHPERVEDYLEHIAEAIQRARGYANQVSSLEELGSNQLLQDGIIRNITIIGEAVNHIQRTTPEFIAAHPEVPWAKIRGMRNIIVHEYFNVDLEAVFDTVKKNLPEFQKQIDHALTNARKGAEMTKQQEQTPPRSGGRGR